MSRSDNWDLIQDGYDRVRERLHEDHIRLCVEYTEMEQISKLPVDEREREMEKYRFRYDKERKDKAKNDPWGYKVDVERNRLIQDITMKGNSSTDDINRTVIMINRKAQLKHWPQEHWHTNPLRRTLITHYLTILSIIAFILSVIVLVALGTHPKDYIYMLPVILIKSRFVHSVLLGSSLPFILFYCIETRWKPESIDRYCANHNGFFTEKDIKASKRGHYYLMESPIISHTPWHEIEAIFTKSYSSGIELSSKKELNLRYVYASPAEVTRIMELWNRHKDGGRDYKGRIPK